MIDKTRLREALDRLDKQRAAGSAPAAIDFATVVEDGQLDLICAAARLVLDAGNALDQERRDIIACIRSTSWGGSEEIVEMIKRRIDKP